MKILSGAESLPTRPQTRDRRPHLASLVKDFRTYGSQIAAVSRTGLRQNRLTYAELATLAGRFAALLESREIRKGERVVLWGESGGDWLVAFWGCVLRGVIVVPVDASSLPFFAERVIREVSPKLIVCDGEKLNLAGAIPALGARAIALDDLAVILPSEPLVAPANGLAETDVLQIIFTSGTTGDPKGIVHTHHNVLASFLPIEREIGKYLKFERPFHPLRFLVTPPLSHVFGQFMGIWIPILLAAEVHFESRYVAGDLIATIHRERISVLAAVPRVLEILRSNFDLRFPDLGARSTRLANEKPHSPVASALRRWWTFRDVHRAMGLKFWAVVSGGATLDPALERFWRALGFVVVQGYGMTETTALVSLTHPFHPLREDDAKNAGGYVGKVLPGRDVKLGADGEVLVSGEMISQATWQGGQLQPRATSWLATGDLASIDESGNMRFRGRKKDVIVSASGLNIYPADLEAALVRQPEVKAAAVIEFAGTKGGEPMAVLVMRGTADPAEAVRLANSELADFQQIRRWTVWPEPDLPRGPTGKILHRVLSEELARTAAVEGSIDANATTPALAPNATTLLDLIANITGKNISGLPDVSRLSEDLQLDSLGRVELQSSIETRFGISIDDAEYQCVKTLGELKNLLNSSASNAAAFKPITSNRPPEPTNRATAVSPGAQDRASLTETPRRDQHVYPTWPWSPLVRAVRVLFREAIMRPLVRLLAAPRVECDIAADATQPLLIVANHVTVFDVPLILFALPRHIRNRVAVAMAGEMLLDWRNGRSQGNVLLNFAAPFQYWLVTALFNVFPLPQAGNFRASFAHAGRAMDRGYHVLVFPEGRRTPDGKIHTFQRGSGLLWKNLHAAALPVFLGGISEIKAAHSRWFHSGRIRIHVGETLTTLPTWEPAECARELEGAVREAANPRDPPA